MRRVVHICFALGMLCAVVPGAHGGGPKRVLILDPFGRDSAPFREVVSAFRSTLADVSDEPLQFYDVPLDLVRFGDADGEESLVKFLESQLRHRPVDVIVPIGGVGARFVVRYRERLFAGMPVLIIGADSHFVPPDFLRTNATLVTQPIDLGGIVEDILQMKPETTNIVVVFGSTDLERFWIGECRREFAAFTNVIRFTWPEGVTLGELVEQCSRLPPNSFILHGLFLVDAAGVPCDRNVSIRRLHESANAPIFGFFASEFGLGPIGGRLYQNTTMGAEAARVAGRMLAGERPETIPPVIMERARSVYDWRELQRWGVDESRLPEGSIVQFRQPTFWEDYKWPLAGAAAFFLLETGLVVGLVINRATRRMAEAEARDLSGRLINAHERERTRLGRELHDDLTQRVARLAIDAGVSELDAKGTAAEVAMRSMRESLAHLSEDIHALSYRLHPSVLQDLGLVEALKAECERFTQVERIATDVKVGDLPGAIPEGASLGLYRVAQEAIRNVARHAKATRAELMLLAMDGGVHLSIVDDGIGFDPSSDGYHHGLGLASMKERMHLLGGELEIDSAPGNGTTILAWVPLEKG